MAQADSVPSLLRVPITGSRFKAPTTVLAGARRVGDLTEDPTPYWYERITGRMPVGCYIVILCYMTAAILMGWWPWNMLLILPVLLRGSHVPLRFSAVAAPKVSVWSKLFCLGGGSL